MTGSTPYSNMVSLEGLEAFYSELTGPSTPFATPSYVQSALSGLSAGGGGGGGYSIASQAPSDTSLLWIDSSDVPNQGLVAKVYYSSSWQTITGFALWG